MPRPGLLWGCSVLLLLASESSVLEDVVLDLPVTGLDNFLLRNGDEPCTAIRTFCASPLIPPSTPCEAQMVPVVQRHLDLRWQEMIGRNISLPPEYHCGCRACAFGPVEAARSRLADELLELLKRALASRNSNSPHLEEYNQRRLQLSVPDKVLHYRDAIQLLPKSAFVIDQLALSLRGQGWAHDADLLLQNAVVRGIWPSVYQRPTSRHVDGLKARAWHKPQNYPFVPFLLEHQAAIKQEYEDRVVKAKRTLAEQNEGIHSGGDWNELVLRKHREFHSRIEETLPVTSGVINQIAQEFDFEMFNAKFSILAPGTRIQPHCGPSNARLRLHLTISHSGGAHIRVGNKTRTWKEDRILVFDDSFEHEVWHDGRDPRVILIMDFWHPDLPEDRRVFERYD